MSCGQAWLAILLCAWLLPAGAQPDIPYLTGRVVDQAELLSPGALRRLTEAMRQHEQKTTNQLAVLTTTGLGDESIEDYAVRVMEHWQLGRRDRDNGVLIIVAPRERRMRIEVGYGLEGTLPDVRAARIIRNVMTPRFKAGDFEDGIERGVSAVIAALEGSGEPASSPAAVEHAGDEFIQAPNLPLHEKILLGAFIFGIIGLFTFIGIVTPGAGWFLYLFLIPFWAMFPIVILGSGKTLYVLIAYLAGFPLTKLLVSRSDAYRKAAEDLKRKGVASVGGFAVSTAGRGSWRSGSSGSFSSGRGFSGGGGRSGGGGASGSW